MASFVENLPDNLTRSELEEIIINRAANDAIFWQELVDNPRAALGQFFGKPVPDSFDVKVMVEDANSFYHVVAHPDYTEESVVPPVLKPRVHFQGRLNYLLSTDEAFQKRFEQHPESAVADAFQFRMPSTVKLIPLVEGSRLDGEQAVDQLYLVLPYAPHSAMFDSPYALSFSGNNSYVEIPDSPSLATPNGLTVEAWFRAPSFLSGNWQDPIVSKHGPESGWELRVGEAIPRFLITIGGVHYYAEPSNPMPFLEPNQWYYVAGVYDGRTLQLHLNGELLYETQVSGQIQMNRLPMMLGANANLEWKRFYEGLLDEVRLWNVPLPAETIRSHRFKRNADDLEPDSSLCAYYRMSEGNGNVLGDASSHGNNGTLCQVLWERTGVSAPP